LLRLHPVSGRVCLRPSTVHHRTVPSSAARGGSNCPAAAATIGPGRQFGSRGPARIQGRVAPDGAAEDGVVIPVSNGAICSLLQDRCWQSICLVYREAQTSQLRSLTLSSLYLARDKSALMHRHVALVRWTLPHRIPRQAIVRPSGAARGSA
jgi:hypothetical protein